MIALMATLKDKPEWNRKVFDEQIVSRWRSEALEFGKTMAAVQTLPMEPRNDDEGEEGEEEPQPGNGASIEFDGQDRQKLVSERMFDYVGYSPKLCRTVLTQIVHC